MTSPYWAKLWIEILDDPKVAGMPDWLFRRFIYFVLAAKEQDNNGLLQPVKDLAWRIRISVQETTDALSALGSIGVTRETAEGWELINFVKRQEREDITDGALRMRRLRERKKSDAQCDASPSALLCSDSVSISDSVSDSLTEHNIFILYEKNIGLVPQILIDELKDAEKTYMWSWIERAFQIAAENSIRKWNYVRAILKRWETEGFDNGVSPGKNGKGKRGDRKDTPEARAKYAEID
jgi:DnaD/phage-associated family protein